MKKKVIIPIIIMLLIIIVVIIYFNTRTVMICTYTSSNDIYNFESKYIVKYKKDRVLYLESKETLTADDEKMLEEYKQVLELLYSNYNSLEYYSNKITLKDNKLTTITKANYDKINIDELVKIDEESNNLIRNNQVSLYKLKETYKEEGAKCIYK